VPFLKQSGWSLFVDCDILCLSDINELFALADDRFAVMCVKHNQNSGSAVKMDGQVQTYYTRKNWSSAVLWNCDHPANKRFTLEHLNTWPGRDLHAFKWLEDSEIGELPQMWNWLINVTPAEPEKKGIWHYTLGGPWFKDWSPDKHDEVWLEEAEGD
jgi:lipopolysaccharide biosynthesis glycosyltransferase